MTVPRRAVLKSFAAVSLLPAVDRIALPPRMISCFDVRGLTPAQVVGRLAETKIRTTTSPYRVSYARVCGGIMNKPEDIDLVLREIRTLAGGA